MCYLLGLRIPWGPGGAQGNIGGIPELLWLGWFQLVPDPSETRGVPGAGHNSRIGNSSGSSNSYSSISIIVVVMVLTMPFSSRGALALLFTFFVPSCYREFFANQS